MTVKESVFNIARAAKVASRVFGALDTASKNRLLSHIAEELVRRRDEIIAANDADVEMARVRGIAPHVIDRLVLNEARIKDICDSLGALVLLDDPVGDSYMLTPRADIDIECRRVPIGVVGIIYEARPNVTVDAAALCLKTGNAVVLRGGREAALTNKALVDIMKKCLADCDIDENVIGFIEPGEGHESAEALMTARGLVDVLIPRGSKRLIDATVANSTVPVIETGAGNCHLYVDSSADLDMAVRVAINAKCSRPAVCNAIETLLVHKDVAHVFLPKFQKSASENYELEIRGCERTRKILPDAVAADELDFATEYNDFILAVKIVDDVCEAVEHINKYGTGHSEAIVTRDGKNADYFCNYIDAAAVYVNASTRFTDGGEFGFGAEIGISTQKLHARGPMGLFALTTQKYFARGNGSVR